VKDPEVLLVCNVITQFEDTIKLCLNRPWLLFL